MDMITKKVEKALNEQIKREEDSSRLYQAMAASGGIAQAT
jgi:ferritin